MACSPLRLGWGLVLCGLIHVGEALGQEEEFIVEGDTVVVADGTDSAAQVIAIEPREVEGEWAYHRQSSDAFVDPDDRMNLRPKYYFVLTETAVPSVDEIAGPNLGRATSHKPIDKLALYSEVAAGRNVFSEEQADWFPMTADQAGEHLMEWEWLDYHATSLAKLMVMCVPSDDGATLHVLEGSQQEDRWEIERELAKRQIPQSELPRKWLPGALLDTWDRPKSLGQKGAFFGRVIAVLKQIDGRAAVEFYGEALHEDSDCRLWLPELDGLPVAIRFVEVPIIKSDGQVALVTVLGLTYENESGARQSIAVDYPLCSPPILEQLRRLAGNRNGASEAPSAAPDLAKLIGEDVLDEFSRRLVAGTYR